MGSMDHFVLIKHSIIGIEYLLGLYLAKQTAKLRYTEIPRRIKAINIFISRVDDFDDLIVSLAAFSPMRIIFCDPLSQIRVSERFFLAGLNRNNGLSHEGRSF